jgi:hypothetical protein
MAYGFVILTPAPFFFSPKPFRGAVGQLILASVLSAQGLWRLTFVATSSPLVTYAPFLLSLCTWGLILNDHSKSTTRARAGASTPDVARSEEAAKVA